MGWKGIALVGAGLFAGYLLFSPKAENPLALLDPSGLKPIQVNAPTTPAKPFVSKPLDTTGLKQVDVPKPVTAPVKPVERKPELEKKIDAGKVMTAAMIAALLVEQTVSDANQFKSAREFAAWLGLVPRQKASGMKNVLSGISKRGDKCIRRLLISGAIAIVRYSRAKPTPERVWINALLDRRPAKVAAVALANKNARIAWALMTKNQSYQFVSSAAA